MSTSVMCAVTNTEKDQILLLEKLRPVEQHKMLNMPSGLVKGGEFPLQAAIRVFEEVSGINTKDIDWRYELQFITPNNQRRLIVYSLFSSSIMEQAKAATSEKLIKLPVSTMWNYPLVGSLKYIIPLVVDDRLSKPIVMTRS